MTAHVPRAGTPLDATRLKRLLGYNLRRAEVRMRGLVAEALGRDDLRAVEYSMLSLLASNRGVTHKQLGEALSVKRPNLVALVDRLEARGLIERAVVDLDRRSQSLALTAAGSALLARMDARLDALEAAFFATWSARDKASLRALLTRIQDQ
ncbi:MAG: MarR family transcriptional regulator [Burkholderiales bacterium]|nr:MarR family transcriptional regulator [Burkholderiales bacterium]